MSQQKLVDIPFFDLSIENRKRRRRRTPASSVRSPPRMCTKEPTNARKNRQ